MEGAVHGEVTREECEEDEEEENETDNVAKGKVDSSNKTSREIYIYI